MTTASEPSPCPPRFGDVLSIDNRDLGAVEQQIQSAADVVLNWTATPENAAAQVARS